MLVLSFGFLKNSLTRISMFDTNHLDGKSAIATKKGEFKMSKQNQFKNVDLKSMPIVPLKSIPLPPSQNDDTNGGKVEK